MVLVLGILWSSDNGRWGRLVRFLSMGDSMAFLLTFMVWFGLVYGLKKKSFFKGVAAAVFFPWPILKFAFYVLCVGVAFASMMTVWLFDWGFAAKEKGQRVKVRPASFEKPREFRRMNAVLKGHA